MRITTVLGPFHPAPPLLGGAVEKVHIELARAYAAAGHEAVLVSRRYGDLLAEEWVDGVRYLRAPSSDRTGSFLRNVALDLRYSLAVARILPRSDVTVTNSFFLPLVLPLARAGKIFVHVARFPKRQMWLYARASRLQAISGPVGEAIKAQSPSSAAKVVVVGYPVSRAFFAETRKVRDRTVLFVGRVAREKGVHLLIRAFARLQELRPDAERWTLRIVGPHAVAQGGDGEAYLDELRELAAPLGARCRLVGPIFEQAALIAEYQAASVFAYPSLADTGEAFGLAALEAMAAGCATVVSNLACFDDFVRDGVNALKFDHHAAEAEALLAAALAQLIGEPALLARLAQEGEETARRFSVQAIAAQMISAFEAACAESASPAPARLAEQAH